MLTTENKPYLTAWVGFVAILAGISLVLGLLFSSNDPSGLVVMGLLGGVGFFVFKVMIQHHIMAENQLNSFHSNSGIRFPYLTGWLGFLVLSLIPTLVIDYLANFVSNPAISFIINLILWTAINYFIFRFIVNKHIVSQIERMQLENDGY